MSQPATRRRHLQLVTNSELKTLRRCMREHRLAYVLGYRPLEGTEAAALRFGTLLHLGLEAYWTALRDSRPPLPAAFEAIRDRAIDDYELARAHVLLYGYHHRWSADHASYEVIGVELEFVAQLINPETGHPSNTYLLGGKLDVLVCDRGTGLYWMIEHKTTSESIEPGGVYWRRLLIDAQVSMYHVGARALGYELAGCIYDVIGKPRHSPLMATPIESRKVTKSGKLYSGQRDADETPEAFYDRLTEEVAGIYEGDELVRGGPDKYFARQEIVRLKSQELESAYDVWQLARLRREAELAGRHPRNPEACFRWGRPCDFFDVCTGVASLDDTTRFRRLEHVHEELIATI